MLARSPLRTGRVLMAVSTLSTKIWLGTERARTTANATLEGSYSSLPFGDGTALSGTDNAPAHFAGLAQDLSARAGLSQAMFREYRSTSGTWLSPDSYSGSYKPVNPQTFNRYVYAGNSPLTFVDPYSRLVGGPQ